MKVVSRQFSSPTVAPIIAQQSQTSILQKNLLFRKGIGIQNFSGPSSYSCKRNRNYSFTLIPLKGKEYQHLPEF